MAHLRIPKRTTQIDRDREVQIGQTADGQPIWTDKGNQSLTLDQKHELSHNLAAQRRYAAIQQILHKVLEAASGFYESIVVRSMPVNVLANYQNSSESPALFVDWLVNSGFRHKWEGLTFIVTHSGKEVARTTATVPTWAQLEVIAALRTDQIMEEASDASN